MVGPFSRCACVAMLEMLSEVIRSEEFLGLVAFAMLVNNIEMITTDVPVWWIWKLIATKATDVGRATRVSRLIGAFDAC